MTQTYEVDLDLFKGPMDLLLYLVRREEIPVRDIQICRITDQYMAYIEALKELDLELAGDFLVMAAILMRLKARELLPQSERDKLEADPDFIDREKLLAQIEEYERFKKAAETLRDREEENFGTFYRTKPDAVLPTADDFLAQKDVEIYDLLLAFRRIVEAARNEPAYFLEADHVTIDDRIEHVMSLISEHKELPFTRLFETDRRKIVIVVTFMAILELIKMQHLSFRQDDYLGEIFVAERTPSEDLDAMTEGAPETVLPPEGAPA